MCPALLESELLHRLWWLGQDKLEDGTMCGPVNLGVLRAGQELRVQVPFRWMVDYVEKKPFHDRPVELFHLSIGLRVVHCREQFFRPQKTTYFLE